MIDRNIHKRLRIFTKKNINLPKLFGKNNKLNGENLNE